MPEQLNKVWWIVEINGKTTIFKGTFSELKELIDPIIEKQKELTNQVRVNIKTIS